MKNITTSVLGFDVPVNNVPETLQEAITAAGGEQQLLDGWLAYIRFHRTNTEARSVVAERIGEITGIERKTKEVAAPTKTDPNNTREEWDETEGDYVKRAIAEHGVDMVELLPLVLNGGYTVKDDKGVETQSGPLSVDFSAQGAVRSGGPKKLAQVYTKSATQLIGLGPEKYENAVKMLEQANPGTTIARGEDNVPTIESLAAALKTNKERVEKEANTALGL
jgi:hypothetical protein